MRYLLSVLALVIVALSALDRADASVIVDIDRADQSMAVSVDGMARYYWRVSTARRGYITPPGSYHPQMLARQWFSRLYYNSPMPHSIFFYGQYAIHGTTAVGNLGRPASHGCVRISPGNAATLFAMVQRQGAEIRIVGSPFSDEARSERRSQSPLAFAPIRHTRTLKQWARDPLAR